MSRAQRSAATNTVAFAQDCSRGALQNRDPLWPLGPGSAAHHERAHGHSIVSRDVDALVLHRIRDTRL